MPDVAHVFVKAVPATLAPDTVYISAKYELAAHLCLCGCGTKVVTPLAPAGWTLTSHKRTITLRPSIGNGAFACRSHYLITNSTVQWLPAITASGYARARERDERDLSVQLANDSRWWRAPFGAITGILRTRTCR